MTERSKALTQPQRAAIVAALVNIRDQLDQAKEPLAAVHITHALDCLGPESRINLQGTSKLH